MKKILCALILFAAPLIAKPQAIIFDFGGVMCAEPKKEEVVAFISEIFNFTPEAYEEAHLEKRLTKGKGFTDIDFWEKYAVKKGTTLPSDFEEKLNAAMIKAINIDHDMYVLVNNLKNAGFKVGLLSDIDDRLAHLLRSQNLYTPFEPCLLSCEMGVNKPDPKIYHMLIETLNLPPQDIVFIDDKLENVEAAKAVGIDALHFTSQEKLLSELKERL